MLPIRTTKSSGLMKRPASGRASSATQSDEAAEHKQVNAAPGVEATGSPVDSVVAGTAFGGQSGSVASGRPAASFSERNQVGEQPVGAGHARREAAGTTTRPV